MINKTTNIATIMIIIISIINIIIGNILFALALVDLIVIGKLIKENTLPSTINITNIAKASNPPTIPPALPDLINSNAPTKKIVLRIKDIIDKIPKTKMGIKYLTFCFIMRYDERRIILLR